MSSQKMYIFSHLEIHATLRRLCIKIFNTPYYTETIIIR